MSPDRQGGVPFGKYKGLRALRSPFFVRCASLSEQVNMLQSAPALIARPGLAARDVPPTSASRNIAVDVYRGFVMFLMMAEVLRLSRVAAAYPGNWFWSILAYNQTHVEWAGC